MLRSSSPELRLFVVIDAKFVPVLEINHIQGTVDESVNISDKNLTAYHRFPLANGEAEMGLIAHIFFVGGAPTAALNPGMVAVSEVTWPTRLWRQFERDLIDRHAILAEHSLQSGSRDRNVHMTITGTRFTSGT